MKRVLYIFFLFFCFIPQVVSADVIVMKNKKRYQGTVVRIAGEDKDKYVVKTVDGTLIVLARDDISKIIREDNSIWDFEEKMRYFLKVRRPFLPFIILGVAAGAYGVKKFQDYRDHHRMAQDVLKGEVGPGDDYTYLNDQSKKDLAWCVVSGLFSAGSFLISFKSMEVKIPIGRLNLSTTSSRVTLALHF